MLFSHIGLEVTSCNMKPMPMILIFSATRDRFYSTWNFHWDPCMVKKRADIIKDYMIYVAPPVLH